jgi:hypothetical protein
MEKPETQDQSAEKSRSRTTSPSDLEHELRENFEELLPELLELNTQFDQADSFIFMAKMLDKMSMALLPRGQMVTTSCAMKLAADMRLQHVFDIAKSKTERHELAGAVQTMLLGLSEPGGHG